MGTSPIWVRARNGDRDTDVTLVESCQCDELPAGSSTSPSSRSPRCRVPDVRESLTMRASLWRQASVGRMYAPLRMVRSDKLRAICISGKGTTDVAIFSKELCTSRRTVCGPEGGDRAPVQGDPGTRRIDRSHRREDQEAEQIRLIRVSLAGPV